MGRLENNLVDFAIAKSRVQARNARARLLDITTLNNIFNEIE